MPKRYTKLYTAFLMLSLLGLQACTTIPSTDSGAVSSQIDISPEAKAEFSRALDMLRSGQHGVALQLFQQMAQRYPQLAGAQVNIGIIYLQDNKTQEAIAALKQAIQINPGNAAAHHHLGIAYRQTGQFSAAKDAYLQALKINPDYANAHLNLGILYDIYLQQQVQALEQYQQYQRLMATEDKQVANWIIDLERRVNSSKPAPQGGS